MHQRAVVTGGCFWTMQDLIRKLHRVISTCVGYTGSDMPNAMYLNHGAHAKGIQVGFDTTRRNYRRIREHIYRIDDHTKLSRRCEDIDSSYRSAMSYISGEKKRIVNKTIAEVESSSLWQCEVVTEFGPLRDFWEAEPEDQGYLERQSCGYTCRFRRPSGVVSKRETTGERVATPARPGVDGRL